MIRLLKKYPMLAICLFAGVMLLPNLDTLQVSIMEARNFITAREMIENDNWLLTTMNGEPRYQKPPLPTWITALSGALFGTKSLFGMRLPAILMVMLLGNYMYFLSRSILKSRMHSMVNALLVMTSFYVIGITVEAPWDIFTHTFMLVGIYSLHKFFKAEDNNWKQALFAGFFIGLSILSKGPISIYALLLPFLIAYAFSFRYKHLKGKIPAIFTIVLIALAIGGWWYLYVRLQDPTTFEAIASAETSKWKTYNTRPIYYYWSFFTQSGLWTIPAFISLLYPYLKRRVSHYKAYKFSFLWTITAVILLSLVPTKKSRYLMPVLIPLAFNIGFYIEYLFRKFKHLKDKRETLPVYFNFGLIALIGIAFPVVMYMLFKTELQGHWLQFITVSIVLVALSLAILLQLKNKNIKPVFFLTVAFFASVFIIVLPLSKVFLSEDYKPISALKEENDIRNIKLYAYNYVAPETIWQYGAIIPQTDINNLPLQNKFGILTIGISPSDVEKLKVDYTIKKVADYNLNQAKVDSKQYNDRLLGTFYILTKK